MFLKEVLLPQLDSGIEIGLGYRSALIDHNVAAIDFICDGDGSGFYLLPGDPFSKHSVSEETNLITKTMHEDLVQLHDRLRAALRESTRCEVVSTRDTMDSDRIIALLTYPDHYHRVIVS